MRNVRILRTEWRRLILWLSISAVLIVAGGGLSWYADGGPVGSSGNVIRERPESIRLFQPATIVAIFSAGAWVLLRRSDNRHPAVNSEYRAWLQTTPWKPGVPLP